MATTPENEEPGFEHDVNELSEDQGSTSEHTSEEPLNDADGDLEEAQEDAAHEREEKGGYQ